ncbi:hypothetical protein CBL_07292 [Carabus blaptoides fortunei]
MHIISERGTKQTGILFISNVAQQWRQQNERVGGATAKHSAVASNECERTDIAAPYKSPCSPEYGDCSVSHCNRKGSQATVLPLASGHRTQKHSAFEVSGVYICGCSAAVTRVIWRSNSQRTS